MDAREAHAMLDAIFAEQVSNPGPRPELTAEEIRAREEEEFWANAGYEYSRIAPYME